METEVKTYWTALTAFLALTLSIAATAAPAAPATWTEGVNYYLIENIPRTAQPTGKVEVIEVFSYGCPACNEFAPFARQLRASLPANATFSLLPAAFNTVEDWPMFQRAYLTAQQLGIADKTHDAMFDAIWKTGELPLVDANTGRPRNPLPTIEDAARFYQKHAGVKAADFVAAATSMSTGIKIKSAEEFIRLHGVDKTPTIVIGGKYRTDPGSAGGYSALIDLVNWLVAKETKK